MDYHHGSDCCRCCCSPSHGRRRRHRLTPKWSLFMAFVAVGIALADVHIQPAKGQDQNAPPILYVRERNWRISESEQINQIIDRVRAEDPDGDDLVFGLEPRFMPHAGAPTEKLPFRIDSETGVVYLNESLEGRAGENFLIYITVTDGQYTAKNEVFINILGRNDNKFSFGAHQPPSISNVVQNISQFLPAFDKLPGVQSIRNQMPNRRPTNSLPPGFPGSLGNYGGGSNVGFPPLVNFYPNGNLNQQVPFVPATAGSDGSAEPTAETVTKLPTTRTTPELTVAVTTTAKSRTKLTPISAHNEATHTSIGSQNDKNATRDEHADDPALNSVAAFTFRSTIIPAIIGICALFATAAVIVGFLYRKRLCAISKTLKKKSKEEMAKKSNQSNLSSTLTDDSRNSMVLQQWNGPVAYGNRYVPWERDQQLTMMATSQLSTSASNGEIANHAGAATGNGSMPAAGMPGIGLPSGGVAGGGVMGNGVGAHGSQSKYDRWEFPRHRLKFFNILGEGAFGQVWRCEATDIDGKEGITTVAVKTLKESAAEIEKKDLLSELEVMKSLEPHVNVVRLLGSCIDKDPTFVIIEYVNRGKLQTYLRSSRAERHYGNTHGKSNILTSGDLTSFMYQVAKGMDYLTSRGIIHRDLAARNVLITDDHTCKVADFGFARDVITSKIYERKSEGKLPIRWMAIESLYDNIFSVKSDIWSFGILMWEIVTLGSTPYPGISAADVMRKVRDGYRLEKPEHCRRELYNIMYYCWSHDSNERPNFGEIVQMLDKLLHTEMDYIELERFPDHNYYNIVNLSDEKL